MAWLPSVGHTEAAVAALFKGASWTDLTLFPEGSTLQVPRPPVEESVRGRREESVRGRRP